MSYYQWCGLPKTARKFTTALQHNPFLLRKHLRTLRKKHAYFFERPVHDYGRATRRKRNRKIYKLKRFNMAFANER